MQRLHTLDAEFLYLEDLRSPMHIGALSVFEGPPPSRAEFTRLYSAAIARCPRYRQRVRTLPLTLGPPVWLDDSHFDLAGHLRWTILPAPRDDTALCTLMGVLMSQLLDRERPLWESWVVEGLAERRWALITKVHHSMVDGISGVGLLSALLAEQRDAVVPAAPPWTPVREPSRAELLRATFRNVRSDAGNWLRAVQEGMRQPATALRTGRDLGIGLARLARALRAEPSVSIQGKVGTKRVYAHAAVRFQDVQDVRKILGGTVNDVVLAVLSGAYRALLLHRGDDVSRGPIRSLVPVSTRAAVGQPVLGNHIAALLCELPVHIADPVKRLRAVCAQMTELKTSSHMAEASALLFEIGDLAPPFVLGSVTRAIAQVMHRIPQRSITTVTTNVPGPRQPLYLLGRKMLAYYPYVPITQGVRVGTAILSYDGQLGFGVTADQESVPDVEVLTRALGPEMAALLSRARLASTANGNGPAMPRSGGSRAAEPS